jgi:hypothetical protein
VGNDVENFHIPFIYNTRESLGATYTNKLFIMNNLDGFVWDSHRAKGAICSPAFRGPQHTIASRVSVRPDSDTKQWERTTPPVA